MFRKAAALLGFSRASSYLMGAFLLLCLLIVYVWQPLIVEYAAILRSYAAQGYPWYRLVDWLLLAIFAFMSLTIMARADLKRDSQIFFVAFCGGLVIESWGTQTNLWHYYTAERPPLWILPAWPIASLSIDRLTRILQHLTAPMSARPFRAAYWLIFPAFYALLLCFVFPTLDKPYTLAALLICALLILTPTDERLAVLIFLAGSGLGYFLERWGTTRGCWIYYTNQTPPLFAVFAHGMAALAFWRTGLLLQRLLRRKLEPIPQ
ncbi:MAG: hypothetical protein OHK0031_02560 [Anaerolineales bacterium]